MKFTLIAAIATLATVAAGTPTMSGFEVREAEAEAVGLVPRVRFFLSPPFHSTWLLRGLEAIC